MNRHQELLPSSPSQNDSESIDACRGNYLTACRYTFMLFSKPILRPEKAGRPKAEITKERIAIRLSPDVLAAFNATGKGWQPANAH